MTKAIQFTLFLLYFLILVGGIVRATGSGMGCPDWPRCFGRWIPPTEISQLPPNYTEIYKEKLKGEVVFNPIKTWTEYLNRLLGVLTGLAVLGTALLSLPYWRKDKTIVLTCFFAAFLTALQGGLGAKVVATELYPNMVTLHMMVAILIVLVMLYAQARLKYTIKISLSRFSFLAKLLLIFSSIQIGIGTQVREQIDKIALHYSRSEWIHYLDLQFYLHRSFSLVLLGVQLWILYFLYKKHKKINFAHKLITGLIFAEILTGITLSYISFPFFVQPLHLTLAVMIVGVQFQSMLEDSFIS